MKRRRHWTYTGEKRRLQVLRRDNWECQIRGEGCLGTATTVDHIHPKAWGGTDAEVNLRAACKPCNLRKGARFSVPQGSQFFISPRNQERRLLKISPRSRWGVETSDYSRREASDGSSSR